MRHLSWAYQHHNDATLHHCVSNHRQLDHLLNSLFTLAAKLIFQITDHLWGYRLVKSRSVSISWCHRGVGKCTQFCSHYNTTMRDLSRLFTGNYIKIRPTSSSQSDSPLNSFLWQIRVSALKSSPFFNTIADHSLSSANGIHCVLRETLSRF